MKKINVVVTLVVGILLAPAALAGQVGKLEGREARSHEGANCPIKAGAYSKVLKEDRDARDENAYDRARNAILARSGSTRR